MTPRYASTDNQEPLRTMHMAGFIAGMTASVATLSAFIFKQRIGIGQHVDVSQLEAVAKSAAESLPFWPYEHRSVSRVSRAISAPEYIMRCKDGWIMNHCSLQHHWQRLVEVMGKPEWAKEELFNNQFSRGEYWDSLKPLIEEWTLQHTKSELFEMAKSKSIPLGPVNSIAETLENPHLKERKFFIDITHPKAGKLTYPGAPYKLQKTPWATRRPAPLLGQYNKEIYCEKLGYSEEDLVKMYEVEII